jgi:ankyrin repeat protein
MDNISIFRICMGLLILAPFLQAVEVDVATVFEEKQMVLVCENGDFNMVQNHILAANGGELAAHRALLAFAYAAKNHRPDWIYLLLDSEGFSKEEFRKDAIFNAIFYRWSRALEILFEGSIVYGSQALMIACHYGRTKIAKFLIEKKKIGATVRDHQGFSILHHAVVSGNAALFDYLLEDTQLRTDFTAKGSSLIYTAIAANQLGMVEKLRRFNFKKSLLAKAQKCDSAEPQRNRLP